jgi:uncharacterized protein YhjY with autotransporter beta-barrel domain
VPAAQRLGVGLLLLCMSLGSAAQTPERPQLRIEGSRAVALESSSDPVRLTVVADMPAPAQGLRVQLGFAGGTAEPGVDFLLPEQMPVIAAGARSVTVELTLIDNRRVDGDRSLGIEIRPDRSYTVAEPARFLLLIRDDDDDEAGLRERLNQLVERVPDPLLASQIETLGRLCASERPEPGSNLAQRCSALRLAMRDPQAAQQLVVSLRGLLAEELSSQRRGFRSLAQGQLAPIAQRLQARREGATARFDASGLRLRGGEHAASFGLLGFGGAAVDEHTSPAEWHSGLALFASGSLGRGRRQSDGLEAGYDSDLQNLTLGLDRRFGEAGVVGVFASFSRFDADLAADAGDLALQQRAFGVFAGRGFADGAGFIDASLGFGRGDLRQQRAVRFDARNDEGELRFDDVLLGEADSRLRFAALAFGFDHQRGGFGIGPRLALEYSQLEVDALTERALRGDDSFAVALDAQQLRSLLGRAGLSMQQVWSVPSGVLQLQLDAAAVRQFEDARERVSGRFLRDPQQLAFSLPTGAVDRDYAELGLALNAVFVRGVSGFIAYRRLYRLEASSLHFASLGLRIEF